jgi:hypothetical protein
MDCHTGRKMPPARISSLRVLDVVNTVHFPQSINTQSIAANALFIGIIKQVMVILNPAFVARLTK